VLEAYLRTSPLAHLNTAAPGAEARRPDDGIALRELPFPTVADLRCRAEADLIARLGPALGFDAAPSLGESRGNGEATLARLGPDEWWLIAGENRGDLIEAARAALDGGAAAVTEIGEGLCAIEASGPRVWDLLAKGCPLDLDAERLAVGRCAQSLLSKADLFLLRRPALDGTPCLLLIVRRSFADYAWRWLASAAQEYGLTLLR